MYLMPLCFHDNASAAVFYALDIVMSAGHLACDKSSGAARKGRLHGNKLVYA
jgi:hypothetical protein